MKAVFGFNLVDNLAEVTALGLFSGGADLPSAPKKKFAELQCNGGSAKIRNWQDEVGTEHLAITSWVAFAAAGDPRKVRGPSVQSA